MARLEIRCQTEGDNRRFFEGAKYFLTTFQTGPLTGVSAKSRFGSQCFKKLGINAVLSATRDAKEENCRPKRCNMHREYIKKVTFCSIADVFTNNQGERELWMMKLEQKISRGHSGNDNRNRFGRRSCGWEALNDYVEITPEVYYDEDCLHQ
jgi:hypothetical protein